MKLFHPQAGQVQLLIGLDLGGRGRIHHWRRHRLFLEFHRRIGDQLLAIRHHCSPKIVLIRAARQGDFLHKRMSGSNGDLLAQ